VKVAFLTALSAWPPVIEQKAQRTIRHIALLAPEKISTPAGRQFSPKLPTTRRNAVIARIKRDKPGISTGKICMELDKYKPPVPIPDSWKESGFNSWYAAWT